MIDVSTARNTPTSGFTITRVFAATREDVFDAWTDPERIAAWFGPRGLSTPLDRVTMDVRAGGRWTLTMVSDADGSEYPVSFQYREIVRPERLVMTTDSGGIDGADRQAVVTVTLQVVPNGTQMTFDVQGLAPSQAIASLRQGWESSFDCLGESLQVIA